MFFGGYFIRSTTSLPNPFFFLSIFSRPPPSSFPYIRSSLAATNNFLCDALAIFQCFWPLFLAMFCIGLFASLVQPYIFAFLSFAFRKLTHSVGWTFVRLRDLAMPVIDPALQRLPFKWNALSKSKKRASGTAGRAR